MCLNIETLIYLYKKEQQFLPRDKPIQYISENVFVQKQNFRTNVWFSGFGLVWFSRPGVFLPREPSMVMGGDTQSLGTKGRGPQTPGPSRRGESPSVGGT